ncbi:hypothetical protein AVI53_07035 [Piscirickettsia salmonis]|nr:hypothetical protein PSLF89_607 [Piscirickettsia salmonis LF-89 = ATCC VR-1361]ALY03610.1 hypothetical protein AWE47_12755 [Piscirickettsia salmonis]AMA43174.1 hypothetical protein AWJ11_12985 [Piscirickettsia salmonis]AOS35646.1 hypothetical protein AVM72_10110 [Piscirickettsia salmonis]APS60345.1 hypothetical protein AVI53_07035 [Piscirickettsia salmonis]
MEIIVKLINKKIVKILSVIFSCVLLSISFVYAAGGGGTTSTQTLTNLFTSWQGTLLNILVFIEFVSGFGGVVLIIMGLFQLRSGHSGQGGGQQVQTKSGFIYMTLGGSLLVVGSIAGVLGHSAKKGITADVATTLSAYTFTDHA